MEMNIRSIPITDRGGRVTTLEIQIGKTYKIQIEDMGHKGEAIGRIDTLTVFVEGGLKGDLVEAEILTFKKNYATAKIVKLLKPSEIRVPSPCKVSSFCGGCQIMEMSYVAQLEMKRSIVREHMRRIGEITDIEVLDVLGMEYPFEYRNKGQYPIACQEGRIVTGFYKVRSHEIVPVKRCLLHREVSDIAVNTVRKVCETYGVPIYDEVSHTGNLRRIVVKVGFYTNEVMVVLVTKEKKLPYADRILEALKEKVSGLKTVVQNIQSKTSNTTMGRENKILYGEGVIRDRLLGLEFEISPLSFYQVNPLQTQVLYSQAIERADLSGRETVFDLYCGIGTISLAMAKYCRKVYGVEVVEAAVEDARKNASGNKVENAEFICGKSEEVLPRLYKEGIRADVVVLDPPRKGCEEIVLQTIAKMEVPKIVYVSCNSATLARDMAILQKLGYKAKEVQPVDMFAHSMHVETVCLMSRKEK